MSDFPFAAIGFDLDGTLLDTHADLGAAVNHALVAGGFDMVPVESSKDLIGGGAKVMLHRAIEQQGGLPDDEFRKLYKQMLAFYGENNAVLTRPFDGAEAVMDECDARGIRMAVVTNKFESFARDILTTLGLADRFAAIIGGDSLGKDADGNYRAKPLPDPLHSAREACGGGSFVFIGDSSYDLKAARAAQVPFVAAAYGYCDMEPAEMQADAVIDSLRHLLPALETLG